MLVFNQVSYAYPYTQVVALKRVSFSVKPGESLAIIGANGSGKSTLAKLCNGLLLPSEGEVRVGAVSTAAHTAALRQNIGLLFQNPDTQIISTLVEEDVAFGPENLGVPPGEIEQRVTQALKAVDMQDFRMASPLMLSGGQKQRIALAGIFAMHPKIIVLDEPTSMLDPVGRDEVMRTIGQLRQQGVSIIFITHDMEEAACFERVIVLHRGELVQDGPPKDIFTSPAELERYRLEAPALVRLFSGLQARGLPVDTYILSPESGAEALSACLASGPAREPERPDPSPGPAPEDILATEELNFTYMPGTPFAYQALRNVNFKAPAHEITGLVGSTGSGKTTLIQHFNALLRPSSGTVRVQGRDIKSYKANLMELRKKVGLVFQFPESQLFEENVYADVAFAPLNFGVAKAEIASRVQASLELMDLDFESYRDRSPFSLSGGEMRKAAIAGVLAAQPEILVMDEPLAGLDGSSRKHLLALLTQLQRERGCSLVIISHNLEELFRISQCLGILHEGRLAYQGRLEQGLTRDAALPHLGIAFPAHVRLLQLLKARGFAVPARALTVEQAGEEILTAAGMQLR